MVDVQHGALRAFKEYGLTVIECVIDEFRGVADIFANFLALAQGLFHFVREIDVRAVRALGQAVFLRDDAGGFFAKQCGFQQVAGAQAAARHFVFVGGADATRGGSDFVCAARGFGGFVQFAMIRKNQMCAIADVQAAFHVHPSLRERFDLGDERARIDDHARTDYGMPLWTQDAAGNQLQHVLIFADDDGVPGIVAAGDARDVIERPGEVVHNLALAFVAPLRAYNHHRFHPDDLLDRTCPLTLHDG